MNFNKAKKIVGLSVVAILALSGCASAQGEPRKVVTIALEDDPGNLDPHATSQLNALAIDDFTYDTLLRPGEGGNAEPGLAEEWSITANEARFSIRSGVTCSDGSPLNATTVAKNFERLQNADVNPPYLESNLGGADFTVTADDATREVVVNFAQSFTDMAVTLQYFPHIVCEPGLSSKLSTRGGESGMGTGPYVIGEVVPGVSYELKRRNDYNWGPKGFDIGDSPETIVFRVSKEGATRANELISGQVNIASLAGSDLVRAESREDMTTSKVPSSVDALWFNQRPDRITADIDVRRAISLAFDRTAYVNAVTGGAGQTADGVLAPGKPCQTPADPGSIPETDVKAANKLLDAAGWVSGPDGVRAKNGQRLSLIIVTTPTPTGNEKDVLADMLGNIGAYVEFDNRTGSARLEPLFGAGDWDITQLDGNFLMPSGTATFTIGTPAPEGSNFTFNSNEKLEALAAKASEADAENVCGIWAQVQQGLVDTITMFPVRVVDVSFVSQSTISFSLTAQATVNPFSIRINGA